MPFSRYLLCVLLLVVAAPAFSQQASSSQNSSAAQSVQRLARNPQALAAVQSALTALGGATAIAQAQSWQIQGTGKGTDPKGNALSGTFNWEAAGGEFRMTNTSGSANASALYTGHGSPAYVINGTAKALPTFVTEAQFVPALVASILLNEFNGATTYSMLYEGQEMLGTEPVVVVKTFLASAKLNDRVTAQTWYFDQSSHLPVRLEYLIPSLKSPRYVITTAITLSNYQNVSGVMYPFQITSLQPGIRPRQPGKQSGVATLQSVTVNPSIPASNFDPPTAPSQQETTP